MGTSASYKSALHQSAEETAKKAWADKALGLKIFGVLLGIYVVSSIIVGGADVLFSALNIVGQFSATHWFATLLILLALTAVIWALWRRSAPREVTTNDE